MTHVCDYKGEKSYKQHEGRKYLSQFFERYAYMILYGLVAYAHGFGNLLVGHAAERLIRNILRRRASFRQLPRVSLPPFRVLRMSRPGRRGEIVSNGCDA